MARNQGHNFGHLKALDTSQTTIATPENLITIVIPTIANSPTLETAIKGWQWQDTPVQIIVIDTGTERIDAMRLEAAIHQPNKVDIVRLAPRIWKRLSSRVAAAIDLAIAITETELAILTHDDVFVKTRDTITKLKAALYRRNTVAAGYEMSPRSHITDQWKGMVSHTLTILNVHDIRAENLRWSLRDAEVHKDCEHHGPAWPDTETAFGLRMNELGLTPEFVGHETNDPHFEDDWICHRRSLTSHRFLWPELAAKDDAWQQQTIALFEALYDGN